jgi:uncharacterized protein (TIGR02145 family)
VVIEATPEGVRYMRVLKSKDASSLAKYLYSKVVGQSDDIVMPTSAIDADGKPIELDTTYSNGELTEVISPKVDLAKVKYPIEIDPSPLIVGAAKDNTIDYGSPTTNQGTAAYLYVFDQPTGIARTVLEFDISAIPAGQTLTSATQGIYYYGKISSDPVGRTVWAYKQTHADWVETESTWNIYKTGSDWTTVGGDWVTSSPAGGSTTVPASPGWMSWNILAICQDAYANSIPVEVLVKYESEDQPVFYGGTFFRSRSYGDTSLRPKLTIEYTAAPALNFSGGVNIGGGICLGNGPCSWSCGDTLDYGGDTYNTVLIGSQCWLAKNLNVENGETNQACSITRYCYSNSSANCAIYGGLYTWTHMMCGSSSCNGTGEGQPACSTPVQGICPDGWHIPSYYELTALERQICSNIGNTDCETEFLYDENGLGYFGQDTTTGLGEGSAMAGNASLWTNGDIDNQGAGNNDFGTSGLNVLPSGWRSTGGSYFSKGNAGYLPTSTQYDASTALWDYLYNTGTGVFKAYYSSKAEGFSVRCIQN